ncbi:MAG: TIGR03364 family FAD-dependent oxidoreductase [Bryobacteraceae bacterium]|nr:TIGR03364 family FAD-dependent oxidoreductase [Bryobacteraceae bacterium]
MTENRADVAVVGGGILGLAHAWAAARQGHSVVLFERNPRAHGASIRNFGMIWPIGQPAGLLHDLAMRSRDLWVEVLRASKLPYWPSGSLHLVYREDEEQVAREFAELAPEHDYHCRWLTPAQVLEQSASAEPEGLRGGLWSSTEMNVDPRAVIWQLPRFLHERFGVVLRYGAVVRRIELPEVETGSETWTVDRAVVCAGDDFETLYPSAFRESGITRCKLQMMRTVPQPDGWRLGPCLAAGLTLRFYESFGMCPSVGRLKTRIAMETPEYDKWGIHVMASQTNYGEVTIGDSHQYGLAIDIFDRPEVDELILAYLRTFARFPDMRIGQRWHGVYSKIPGKPFLVHKPSPGVRIVTAAGGAGMTLSFGLAEHVLAKSDS